MLKETIEFRNDLHNIINCCKNMESGYSGEVDNALYVRYKGKPYAVHLIEMDEPTITDKDRKNFIHSTDERIKDWKNIDRLKYLVPED